MSTIRIALANIRVPATPQESVFLTTSAIAEAGSNGALAWIIHGQSSFRCNVLLRWTLQKQFKCRPLFLTRRVSAHLYPHLLI